MFDVLYFFKFDKGVFINYPFDLPEKDRKGKGFIKLCFLSMWAIVAMW